MYVLCLILMLIVYFSIIFLFRYMKNVKLYNSIFIITTLLLYLSHLIKVYLDVGFYDWNFQNTLPTANVSPFTFATLPLLYALPKKVKKYHMLLISLLSVGMVLATIVNCIYFTTINYAFHFHFLLDHIAHLTLSLLGIYFIKSGQINVNKKDAILSSTIIFSVASIMLILNVIFDTSFFGLSLKGKHNIYNNVLVQNSYLSALLYFLGLAVVLFIGYTLSKFLKKVD